MTREHGDAGTDAARQPEARAASRTVAGDLGALIVADDAPVGAGQMHQSAFLARLEAALRTMARREMSGTLWESQVDEGVRSYVARYRTMTADGLRDAVRRYLESGTRPSTADDVVAAVVRRARGSLRGALPSSARAELVDFVTGALSLFQKPEGGSRGAAGRALDPVAAAREMGVGRALEPAARQRMERGFGAALPDVQIHTDAAAAALAGRLGARAFAMGDRIGFAAGRYRPGTLLGDVLLAHELAHAQQQHAPAGGAGARGGVEADADRAAVRAVARSRGLATRPPRVAAAGLRFERCDDDVPDQLSDEQMARELAESQETVDDLARRLRAAHERKSEMLRTMVSSDPEDERELDELDSTMRQLLRELREAGVRVSSRELFERALTGRSLAEFGGRLQVQPDGPYRQGDTIRLSVQLDYVPRDFPVNVTWRWRLADGREQTITDPSGPRDTELVMDSRFWWRNFPSDIGEPTEMTVTAVVVVGNRTLESPALSRTLTLQPYEHEGDPGLLHLEVEGGQRINEARVRALVGSELTFRITRTPPSATHTVLWHRLALDEGGGTRAFEPRPTMHETSNEMSFAFDETGDYSVVARLFPAAMTRWAAIPRDPGVHPVTGAVRVEVGTMQEWGSQALEQLRTAEEQPPGLAELGERFSGQESRYTRMAERASDEADREHYARLAERTREMGDALRDRVGVPLSDVQPFPTRDEASGEPAPELGAGVYAAPVPAALVIANTDRTPGGGVQPLSLYLTMRREAFGFRAVLIDATTKDMSPYEAVGVTVREAATAALDRWSRRNPYPIGGLVVYRFVFPDGTIVRSRFTTTTREKEIEKFLDDMLMVGGYVAAVLLLLAPEATVTKALAIGLLAGSVGYGVYRIHRNMELGVAWYDTRNVLEAVGILAAAAGIAGSAMRSAGLSAARPLMYRAGSWMVLGSVAADAGTLVYIGYESYEQLRASLDDPGLTDDERLRLLTRIAGQLLAQSVMFVVSNRDQFRGGLRRSDYFATRRPGLADLPRLDPETGRPLVELDAGSRLDLQAELIRRGERPDQVLALTDAALIGRLGGVQQGGMRGPGVFDTSGPPLTATDQATVVHDVRTSYAGPEGESLARTSDPTSVVMAVGDLEVPVSVQFAAPPGGGVHGAQSGPGRVRIDYDASRGRWIVEVDVDPRLSREDAAMVLHEELDEAAGVVRGLRGRVTGRQPLTGAGLRRAIERQQRAGLMRHAAIGDAQTAHDVSAMRSLARMFERAVSSGDPVHWGQVDEMLIAMGFNPKLAEGAREDALRRILGDRADPILEYIRGGAFERPLIHVPADDADRPRIADEIRAYTEAIAERQAGDRGADVTLDRIEQLAAAAHGEDVLTVEALMREGMSRTDAERYVAAAGGGNPYRSLYDTMLTMFEDRRAIGRYGTGTGRRITVEAGGERRPPLAVQALAGADASRPVDGISLSEFVQRVEEAGGVRQAGGDRIGPDGGHARITWRFREPGGAVSLAHLDIPGREPATGATYGYEFESARRMHAAIEWAPGGGEPAAHLSESGISVGDRSAAAHIRIVPDDTLVQRLSDWSMLEPGVSATDVLAGRRL